MDRTRLAGVAALLGGLLLFADIALDLFEGLGRGYYAVGLVTTACLAVAVVGSLVPGALAVVGAVVAFAGLALWVLEYGAKLLVAGTTFGNGFDIGGSMLLGLGMLLLGIAVARSRRYAGWQRWAPLVVGVYFFVQIVPQTTMTDSGANGWLLGAWGLTWALLGAALLTVGAGERRLVA
jgi:hypothetical protein